MILCLSCHLLCCYFVTFDMIDVLKTQQNNKKQTKKLLLVKKASLGYTKKTEQKHVHMYIWNESPCICGSVVQSEMTALLSDMNELLSTYECIVINV